jgi:DNA recombination protein Rad52
MDWKAISTELQKKLDPKHIKPAPRGKFGDYVDGHHVISEANRIFGEGGWSYSIERLEMVSDQTVTLKGRDGTPYEQYRVGYMATVRVTVDGVTREGAAVGSGVGSPDNMADHHESAVKEAETDALKRALRTFGNTFGLALYDKTRADIGVDAPPAAETRDRILTAIRNRTTPDALDGLWSHKATVDAIAGLPEPMQGELQKAKTDRDGELA